LRPTRLHNSSVNAVAILKDRRDVTAGDDARIGIWTPGKQEPDIVLERPKGPIVGLALSPDGATLASASWDGGSAGHDGIDPTWTKPRNRCLSGAELEVRVHSAPAVSLTRTTRRRLSFVSFGQGWPQATAANGTQHP
jgi:WD40 repeat protein